MTEAAPIYVARALANFRAGTPAFLENDGSIRPWDRLRDFDRPDRTFVVLEDCEPDEMVRMHKPNV